MKPSLSFTRHVRHRSLVACSSVCAMLAGCSGDPRVERPPPPIVTGTPHGPDDLPVPRNGFQVRSIGEEIAPGEDVEYCEVGELPGEPSQTYYVKSIEL